MYSTEFRFNRICKISYSVFTYVSQHPNFIGGGVVPLAAQCSCMFWRINASPKQTSVHINFLPSLFPQQKLGEAANLLLSIDKKRLFHRSCSCMSKFKCLFSGTWVRFNITVYAFNISTLNKTYTNKFSWLQKPGPPQKQLIPCRFLSIYSLSLSSSHLRESWIWHAVEISTGRSRITENQSHFYSCFSIVPFQSCSWLILNWLLYVRFIHVGLSCRLVFLMNNRGWLHWQQGQSSDLLMSWRCWSIMFVCQIIPQTRGWHHAGCTSLRFIVNKFTSKFKKL